MFRDVSGCFSMLIQCLVDAKGQYFGIYPFSGCFGMFSGCLIFSDCLIIALHAFHPFWLFTLKPLILIFLPQPAHSITVHLAGVAPCHCRQNVHRNRIKGMNPCPDTTNTNDFLFKALVCLLYDIDLFRQVFRICLQRWLHCLSYVCWVV